MGILWPHSNTVARTNADRRAPGALAYFFEAGTTTPRTTYRDADLATPHMHPVVADAYGRFPAVFIDFGAYRERVKTAGGTQLWDTDDIPNPAPTDPGEGVDPESLLKTGEVFFKFANGTRTGAVRANGRTIGSAASTPTATERANDDCEDLFIALYNAMSDTLCPVSGGRGADAAADFAAGKTLTLPDLRAAAPFGLDDMGNTAAGRFNAAALATFSAGNATTPGSPGGANHHTITEAQIPSHMHGFSATTGPGGAHDHTHNLTTGSQGTHVHTVIIDEHGGHAHGSAGAAFIQFGAPSPTLAGIAPGAVLSLNGATTTVTTGITATIQAGDGAHTHPISGAISHQDDHTHPVSGTTGSGTGGGGAHNNLPRAVLGTWYIKL